MGYEFHDGARVVIDDAAHALIAQLKEQHTEKEKSCTFPSERPLAATITDEQIIGDMFFEERNISGQTMAKYFHENARMVGLDGESYQNLRRIVDQTIKTQWVREHLGAEFVEKEIFVWCKNKFTNSNQGCLSEFLTNRAGEVIKTFSVWVPIAFLEVENEIEFGSVKLKPISAKMINDLEEQWLSQQPKNAEGAKQLCDDMRSKMQGYAAVVMEVEAERNHANTLALEVSEVVIDLIRMYSPAAYISSMICASTILGCEVAPMTTVIAFGPNDSFTLQKSVLAPMPRSWQISQAAWLKVRSMDLPYLHDLINEYGLSDLQKCLRVSILTYSRGLTFRNLSDRLVYTLSALESLLLKDTSEPIQQNLGERMAFAIRKGVDDRQEVVRNVRTIYSLRSKYIHHRVTVSEEEEIQKFVVNTREFFGVALSNSRHIPTKLDFINAIERLKFGG